MDRRLSRLSLWNRDRRLAKGTQVADLLRERRDATFDQLVEAAHPAETSEVAMWLSSALLDDVVDEIEPGAAGEPRRFRLKQHEAAKRWVRRPEDARRTAAH